MQGNSQVSIQGLDEVLARLRALQSKQQINATRNAMRKSMQIVRKSAIEKAKMFDDPRTQKQVWKEIVVRAGKPRPGYLRMRVGVRGGAKSYANNRENRSRGRAGKSYEGGGSVYYWRFLEFGTKNMAARPFMRPALSQNAGRVIDSFSSDLSAAIDKQLAKIK